MSNRFIDDKHKRIKLSKGYCNQCHCNKDNVIKVTSWWNGCMRSYDEYTTICNDCLRKNDFELPYPLREYVYSPREGAILKIKSILELGYTKKGKK